MRIVEYFWFQGFKLFCEVVHPRTRPLILLRNLVRRFRTPEVSCQPASSAAAAAIETRVPKKIWMYWAQGWENAPPLVQLCRDSWKVQHPDWEVSLLDQRDVATYTTFPYSLEGKKLTPTNYSNILRLSILSAHGGVWTDATTFCRAPVSSWLFQLMGSGFFAYAKPKTTLADWVLASVPNHPAIIRWRDYEYGYWRFAKHEWRYFWPHYLFEYLIFLDTSIRRLWQKTPRISSDGPYAAQRFFKGGGDPEQLISLLMDTDTPVHKLDWRMQIPEGVIAAIRRRLNETTNPAIVTNKV